MLFRKRTKRCVRCDGSFISIEMAEVHLHALVDEVNRMTSENERLVEEAVQTKGKAGKLQQAIDRAAKMLSRFAAKQISHRSPRPHTDNAAM